MMSGRSTFLSNLSSKKALLVYNYDLLLDRQTRLASSTIRKGILLSEDMEAKRDLFILDDLTIFSIAARRMIDLCALQSYCDSIRIREIRIANEQSLFKTLYVDRYIGFYALLNRIIHMNSFDFVDSQRHLGLLMAKNTEDQYKFLTREIKDDFGIEPFFRVRESRNANVVLKMHDFIAASIQATEKIIALCSDAGVHLESWFREV